jgi:hypothetical protein
MKRQRNAKKFKTKNFKREARQRKVAEEVIQLDRNLLRRLRGDPLGSSEAALDEVTEIYASAGLAKR